MFLKRLEIFGFKSFAEKTVFEFPPGIVSIVGPNGCGKSNIAEAIRWVLGEQASSNLRSRSMTDVIFNGSEGRKALGLAETSITLDNSHKILPIDFEEVSITRRLFRSGESEYLINKAACRLKDITDLFLDTGIGRHAYSLMEQGKVDLILNSKPKERRSFFEEAAGIMKYRSRREATLHKLETARSNLLRVEDILLEIKRQMDSLYRQKRRAERFKSLKEEIRSLEARIKQSEYLQLKSIFDEDSLRLAALRAELEEKRRRETELTAGLDETRSRMKKAQEELASLSNSTHELTIKIQGIDAEVVRLKERESHLGLEISRITGEIENLKIRNEEITTKRGREDSSKEGWLAEFNSKRERLIAREERLASLEEEKARWVSNLELGKEEQIELLAEIARARNRMSSLRVEEKNLKVRLTRLAGEKGDLEADVGKILSSLAREEEALLRDEEGLKYLLEEASVDEKQLLEKEREISLLDNEISSLKAELKAVEAESLALKRLEKEFAGYFAGVKSILTSGELKGIRGVVADLLDVPAQYESAVEAILAERIQAIVVERIEDAKAAIDYLKEGSRERVTFLPLDVLRPGPPADLPCGIKIIGAALDLVRFDPHFEPVFRYLLGNAYIVEELELRCEIFKGAGAHLRFASLAGDLLDTDGVLVGGDKDTKGLGLLGRKRAISSLEERLTYLLVHLPGLERDGQAKRIERDGLKAKFDEKRECVRHLEFSIANRRMEIERLKEKLRLTEAKLGSLREEERLLGSEQDKIDKEIKGLTLDQRELIEKTRQKQGYISKLQEEINEREILVKEYGLEITQLKVDVAGLDERLKALAESILRLDELSSSLKQEESLFKDRLSCSQVERKEIEALISSLEKEREGLIRDKESAEERLSVVRKGLENIEEGMVLREEELQKAEREAEEARDMVYQLDLKTSQLRVRMEGLEEHLFREYGLTIEMPGSPMGGEQLDESSVRVLQLRQALERIGEVNAMAPKEYEELRERYEKMVRQRDDLLAAENDLREIISQIDKTSRELFLTTFQEIRSNFQQVYKELFEGGRSDLIMTEEDPLETGIEIVAQPPGKRLQNISLLSGGERALTAIALLFAVFMIKPSPFCVLDEIDAALDEANITRFTKMLKRFCQTSQFLIITHNKRTMEISDTLYGITMEEFGVSKLISVRWKEKAG